MCRAACRMRSLARLQGLQGLWVPGGVNNQLHPAVMDLCSEDARTAGRTEFGAPGEADRAKFGHEQHRPLRIRSAKRFVQQIQAPQTPMDSREMDSRPGVSPSQP